MEVSKRVLHKSKPMLGVDAPGNDHHLPFHLIAFRYAQKKADEMRAESFQSALDSIEKLEIKLSSFAKRHQKEIRSDPLFRQRFLELCAPIGVDPLVADKKSFWGQLVGGMGDYYHELAVKIAEVCLASRAANGGIMSVGEVQAILAKRQTRFGMAETTSKLVSVADIEVAVGKLAKLGGGFRILTVGASKMIVSVPQELDSDHMHVMAVAAAGDTPGVVDVDGLVEASEWTWSRAERALELLLQQGMAWLDRHHGIDRYWFPSIYQENKTL